MDWNYSYTGEKYYSTFYRKVIYIWFVCDPLGQVTVNGMFSINVT